MNSNYDLQQLNYKHVRKQQYDLAILPWGATEAHNYHLPYGTDNYQNQVIVNRSAEIASANGAKVVVLPAIPFGVNTGQTDIPLVINMNPSTQKLILGDVVESLLKSGINKLLIFNGHGGNDFKTILREVGYEHPKMCLCTCNWFHALDRKKYFDDPGDHADEVETSLMLYLYPELVLPLDEAGNGQSKKFTVQGLNETWAWSERKWTEVSNDTGVGNPSLATVEKGEQFFHDVCQKMSQFIYDLSKTPRSKFFSY
jgi:creatinine amidohydrolase